LGTLWPAILLTLGIVAYNNLAALLPDEFREPGYAFMSIGGGAVLGLVAWWPYKLGLADLGLLLGYLKRGVCWGAGAGLGIVALVFLATLVPASAPFFNDERAADMAAGTFLYTALVRIPIGTALFEEWAFRGVLYGVWCKAVGVRPAIVVTSIAFGLWHITPSLDGLFVNRPDAGIGLAMGWVLLNVVTTSVGGVFFVLLRLGSGSLAAPVMAHALINSGSLAAAFLVGGDDA
jgi:membrane protease YdiL (CAAX protease family)